MTSVPLKLVSKHTTYFVIPVGQLPNNLTSKPHFTHISFQTTAKDWLDEIKFGKTATTADAFGLYKRKEVT